MPESNGKSRGGPEDRQRQNGRVRAVQQAAGRVLRKGQPYVVAVPEGTVTIEQVAVHEEDGVEWLEVRVAGDVPDPQFRIYNPPTLAVDPAGEHEVGGRRFTEDPLLALAQVLGMYGGAEPQRKLRGRRGLR